MKVSLLGVDFHSANRGCGALGYSIVEILKGICKQKGESLQVTAILFLDQPVCVDQSDIEITIDCIKITPKKFDFWRRCKKVFRESDFILDFSMGDSFSDIYGSKRFILASLLKQMAIWSGTKFIMAPQTIGPFSKKMLTMWAKHILKKCDECFVRDSLSQKYVLDLCGRTPLLTTDVAFSLPYEKVENPKDSGKLKIGFNPSGLVWMNKTSFSADKHVKVEYKKYVEALMDEWEKDENVEVHLIPHVFASDGSGMEDDLHACVEIHNRYSKSVIETGADTPMEIKSVISTMDVFIGARMHATVAAFSSGVATIPFSYSRKFEGLYHDLGYEYLIRGTAMDTDEAVRKTLEWTSEHEKLKAVVAECQKVLPQKQNILENYLYNL